MTISNAPELLKALEAIYADWLTFGANGTRDDKQALRAAVHLAILRAKGEA